VLFGPGGTGRDKGVTDTHTYTYTIPAGSNVATGTSSGSMTF
jgi:hypothetical protein